MQKRRQRSSLLLGEAELIQFLAALAILHQYGLMKRRNRRMDALKNGWSGYPVHTTPNQHPAKIDVLQKTCLQITLAAKLSVQHSSVHPQTSSDGLCLLFCIYPSSMADKLQVLYVIYDYMILYNVTNLNKNGFFLTLFTNIQAFCSIFSFLDFNYNTNMF